MGADKNSSAKRELDLCPKFTTKDSHTSFPRSHSHNKPTNPRNKPQTIMKRKRNSKSKGLSNSALHQADHPQAPGGPSAWSRRTVRGAAADRSKIAPEPPVLHPQKRIVRLLPADRPRRTDCPASPRGLSGKPCATKSTRPNGSKEGRTRTQEELDKQQASWHLADRLHGVRGRSAKVADKKPSPAS
jgi:hypothetical protein